MSKITFVLTQEMIDRHVSKLTNKELSVINKTCDIVGININKLWGASCKTDVSNCRKLLSLYFLKQKYTLVKIGKILRAIPLDHTSVIYSIKCAKNHYQRELQFKNWYNELACLKYESTWQGIAIGIKKSLFSIL